MLLSCIATLCNIMLQQLGAVLQQLKVVLQQLKTMLQ